MDPLWSEIVQEAIKRSSEMAKAPVTGARLRQSLAAVAKERGEIYPPPDKSHLKFADFLRQFDTQLIVLRRPGRDFLVVSANSPQLLVENSDSNRTAEFRADIFAAFTRIIEPAGPKPWYLREKDQVNWLRDEEDHVGLYQIPFATLDSEVALRNSFITAAITDPRWRERFTQALSSASPLNEFAVAIKEARKGREWHRFRFKHVVKTIQRWCAENDIGWSDTWLKTTHDINAERAIGEVKLPVAGDHEIFARWLSTLSNEDLTRIQVPLDLVLRMLAAQK